MKIGILTLHYGVNYGGTLQAYATGEILRQLGHEPYYLDRIPNALGKTSYVLKRRFLYPLLHRDFSMFWRRHLRPISVPAFSSADLHRIVGEAGLDAVLVGSDQVWRKEIFSVDGDYFLGFCDGLPVRRIAFAASFGIDHWNRDEAETREIIGQLKKFRKISVRENSGVELLRERGIAATHILDPVLIAGREAFEKLWSNADRDERGKVVTYFLDPENIRPGMLRTIAERGVAVDHLLPLNKEERRRRLVRAPELSRSIPEWIKRLATADLVITDSFHGMAFSLLFNRDLCVLVNPERGNARMESMLALCGLSDRLCRDSGELARQMVRKIDFSPVNAILAAEREKAKRFLTDMEK